MVLQALILLAARPDVGTKIEYDVTVAGGIKTPTSLRVRITERIEKVLAKGVLQATRTYGAVVATGVMVGSGVELIAGKTDRYLVEATGEWKPATLNTELGFPDFALPARAVVVGEAWDPGRGLNEVNAMLAETTTLARRRAAVVRFRSKTYPLPATRTGSGSYWALDLHDGRPLLARIEMIEPDPEDTGTYTIVRRGVPGLAGEAKRFASPR